MSEWQIAGLAAGLMIYAAVRSAQHAALFRAYRDAHRETHEDRGYYPDRFTGLDREACEEIVARFRELEEKWWMFGVCRERAWSERRMASLMAMHLEEPDA